MKRKILIMSVLLLSVTMLFAVINTVKAAALEDATGAVVQVEKADKTVTYYGNLNEALSNVADGETVKLLADINSTNLGSNIDTYHRAVISGNKTITFNFNGKTITSANDLAATAAAFVVKGGAKVTFEGKGGITNNNGGGALLVTESGSTAILNGGTYVSNGTQGDSSSNYAAVTAYDATLEVNSGATLKSELGSGALLLQHGSTATLNGGTFSQTGTGMKNGKKVNLAAVECESSTLTIKEDVTITADEGSGVFASGTNPTVTIDGAYVEAGAFAVSGNGSGTTNSTITIKAGTTLKSTGTAAIYHPQSGSLTVEGGTIEGYFGIVSRQGTVDVKGGTITATGTVPAAVGDAGEDVLLPVGALVTDNVADYGHGADPATVNVLDGNINGKIATRGDTESDDFNLIGGAFSLPIPTEYLEDSLEVKKGDTYYLGDNAEEALSNAKSGDKLSVINGNVNLNGIHNGVVVTNEGSGKVTLNGQEIKKGEEAKPVVNQAEKDLADLEAKLAELEDKLDKEKIESDKAKADIADLKARVDSLEKENKDLKDRVAKLEEKVAKLEKAQEKAPAADAEDSGELDDEPKTGDTYAVSAGLVSLLSLAGAVVSKKFIK